MIGELATLIQLILMLLLGGSHPSIIQHVEYEDGSGYQVMHDRIGYSYAEWGSNDSDGGTSSIMLVFRTPDRLTVPRELRKLTTR